MQVDTTAGPIAAHDAHGVAHGLMRALKSLGHAMWCVLRFVGNLLVHDDGLPASDHDMAWTSLERMEPENEPSVVDKLSLSSHDYPKLDPDRPASHDPRFM